MLLNGGHGGAMAELRCDFLKKRHRIAVAWRVKDCGAMAAAIAMADVAARRMQLQPSTSKLQHSATTHDPCNQSLSLIHI